ncbi:unnamed protein product [Parnassius apollo]|uniref:(apollo) hypothetical protein n=1 Tax=Parnassius apollo TaxID=110799 RepID=A0A8S3WCS6_PARAO|nr:unnamed protein product [Parnassius apollo]
MNTLDLIFSSFPIKVQKSEFVLVIEDVYHPALYMSATDVLVPSRRPSFRTKYQFQRADYRSMNDLLLKQDWAFITRETSLDRVTDKFYSMINELIEKFVPKIRCGGNYSFPIWYSRALINLIKEKSKLHSSWKKHKNQIDYADFSELRKRQKILEQQCYKLYLTRTQENIKHNPKAIWSYVKSKRKNHSDYPQEMTYGDTK